MRIVLASVDDPLADAWQASCGDLEFVSIHRGSILDVECDAVVSPANSFGFMDGGIDALYTRHFGRLASERLQEAIRARHHGELIVGAAEIVETDHAEIPFLIAAPTMRVPMILSETVNPYLAARAVFLLVNHGTFSGGPRQGQPIRDAVRTVAFPGLGTGVGQVAPEICAKQVRAAIDEVLLGGAVYPASWLEAQVRHQGLYTGRLRDLQFEE